MSLGNSIRDYQKSLRNILKPKSESRRLFEQLAVDLKLGLSVTSNSKILIESQGVNEFTFKLYSNDITYGQLHSDSKSCTLLIELLNLLVDKEIQKKNIGSEVLGLYREINMIYDFSEMISEKIDDESIAKTALDEAKQIIDITHGSVFVLNQNTGDIKQMARVGNNPDAAKSVENQNHVIKALIEKGTSLIVPKDAIKSNTALNHLEAVMYAPLKVKHRTLGLIVLGHENDKEFTAAELKLLTTIAFQSAAAIESAQLYQKNLQEAREREEAIRVIHQASQKFVPTEFIESLGKTVLTEVLLGDKVEREVTVMFADIRGFTTVSESMNPSENFDFVNGFNKRMGPIIRKNDGFIMQYLGDGFMALFPKGSQTSIRAAVEIQSSLKAYNKERVKKKRLAVKVGIGMQNGNLIMGITGDDERLDAAIISDTVNTAARIEGLSKHYGTSIMLTSLCLENLENQSEFNFRYLGPVKVKGKEKPIELYECIDGDSQKLFKHKIETKPNFEKGMELYFEKEFAMAAVTFQRIVKKNKDDLPSRLFLNKSAHLITQELDEDWRGIEAMDKK